MPVVRDAGFVDHLAPNVAVLFLDRVAADPEREAFRFPRGDQAWESVTWRQAGDRATALAAGLLSLGIAAEERVGIASSTRYEWILADLAVMLAGAATTTVYPSTNAEDTAYIVGDSECRILFAEDESQIAKLRDHRGDLPSLHKVVTFAASVEAADAGDDGADGWVITMDRLAEMGEKFLADHPDVVETTARAIGPDRLATLIYTSGTTGRPKGVRLQHHAWVYEGAAIQVQDILGPEDLQFLWLPMAHSFGKVLLSAQLACGFATAIDGRVDKIIDNLAIVKPTFMGAAPRIFEKAYARIMTMQDNEGGAKKAIFDRAFAVGLEVDKRTREGASVSPLLKVQHALFDRLVYSKVRERFGGRVRFFISGSAALNEQIALWFNAAGIVILEGYGLTETSAGAFVNHPDENRIGTVGPPLPGSQARIGEGDEVQIRGPHVMDGYHNLPEETTQAFTEDGWLRTGDKGAMDAEGFLTITGRIKDLFKTSGGKYIAPSAIEAKFKALCPYASQFMVFGDERNFVSALVTLDADSIDEWAAANGLTGKSYADIASSPTATAMIQGYVDQLNAQLNRWETVKRFEILDHDLTVESGELTPSMKVKRNVVQEHNQKLIDGFYGA